MCGIVGAAARRDVVPVLIDGLRKLEYRGYDSCGVAVTRAGGMTIERSVERVSALAAKLSGVAASTGIAHARWATHGAPLPQNAHPILSCGEIAVVHNGIVENHEQMRADLEACNYVFHSETDTEVIAHLVHSLYRGDLLEAVRGATARLRGAYAIAVMSNSEPERVVGARAGSPLVVGHGEGGHYLASDASALAAIARDIAYLDDGDVISITHSSCDVFD